ncbi:MAG: hypothetical protein GX410_08670 [Elusimicrobia bacterium]|nr:hypothetical protein [Elusimicrobiota bacterium]
MKYWAYFEGEIEGPYTPEELRARQGAGPATLVSPEDAEGENEQDWQLASAFPELSGAFGLGASAAQPPSAVPSAVEPEKNPAPPLPEYRDMSDAALSAEPAADLLSLQARMAQLGLEQPQEEDDIAVLEQERKRLAEQLRLRRVINKRTAEIIGGLETGLDDAGNKIVRQIRRVESRAAEPTPAEAVSDSVSGGIKPLGPLFPSWRDTMESNELLQLAASDTALFSSISSGKSVVLPDKPAWPERKLPSVRRVQPQQPHIHVPAPAPRPVPRPAPVQRPPSPASTARSLPAIPAFHEAPILPDGDIVPSQEVSDVVASQQEIAPEQPQAAAAVPEIPNLSAAALAAADSGRVAEQPVAQESVAEESVSQEAAAQDSSQPADEQPAAEPAADSAPKEEAPAPAEPEEESPQLQPPSIKLPGLGGQSGSQAKREISDLDFPFSPKYLAKADQSHPEMPALPSTTARGQVPNFEQSPEQLAKETQPPDLADLQQNPLSSVMGIGVGLPLPQAAPVSAEPQLPDKFTKPGDAPSFTLGDTVPQLSQPAVNVDPRMGPDSKATLAPAEMLNLSKTTMSAPLEQAEAPQPAEPEKHAKSGKMLVLLLLAASLAVVGAIVFFFMREDAGIKNATPQGPESAASTEHAAQSEGEDGGPAPSSSTATAAAAPAAEGSPAQPAAANTGSQAEGSKQALEIVKNYDLGMGRGKIETWLKNSYGAAGTETWSAKQLIGSSYVVEYKLLRARAEVIAYLFEVDVASGKIVRGMDNAAMELLGGGAKAQPSGAAKPAASRKPVDKRSRTAGR